MTVGKDILTEASGGKKGTVDYRVRLGDGKGSVYMEFRRATGDGLTVKNMEREAKRLNDDAKLALKQAGEAVSREMGLATEPKIDAPGDAILRSGRMGVYLTVFSHLEVTGQMKGDRAEMDKGIEVVGAVLRKDWRFPR